VNKPYSTVPGSLISLHAGKLSGSGGAVLLGVRGALEDVFECLLVYEGGVPQ
jgi:hypothetical protein